MKKRERRHSLHQLPSAATASTATIADPGLSAFSYMTGPPDTTGQLGTINREQQLAWASLLHHLDMKNVLKKEQDKRLRQQLLLWQDNIRKPLAPILEVDESDEALLAL